MDLGLEQAGIEIVLACENDPACVKTIQLNKPRLPLLGDIEMLDAVTIRRVLKRNGVDRPDLIVGGPLAKPSARPVGDAGSMTSVEMSSCTS